MADWDADSPELQRNLALLARRIGDSARRRDQPTITAIRDWHVATMAGLSVPEAAFVGAFRGEPGLEGVEVHLTAQPESLRGDNRNLLRLVVG
jgi:hypothetical protein